MKQMKINKSCHEEILNHFLKSSRTVLIFLNKEEIELEFLRNVTYPQNNCNKQLLMHIHSHESFPSYISKSEINQMKIGIIYGVYGNLNIKGKNPEFKFWEKKENGEIIEVSIESIFK